MKSPPRRRIGAPVAQPKSKEAPDTTPEPLQIVRTARPRTSTNANIPHINQIVQPVE